MNHPPDELPQDDDISASAVCFRALAERQFLHPGLPLRTALLQFTEARQMPMIVVDQTLRTLNLDSGNAFGRLGRMELVRLATTLCQIQRRVRVHACAG